MDSESDDEFCELMEEIDKQFQGYPFTISCIKHIEELDEVFTLEPVIFIHDDRANKFNYYYQDMSDEERNVYNHFLKVERIDNKPITLRQVLDEMSNEPHYYDEVVIGDPHCFLELFELSKHSNIQYSMYWGS